MSPSDFKDHFSSHSEQYKRFRPSYPPELFEFLARLCPSRNTAWDCATGSGQAAHHLAKLFDQVYATDASAEQVRQSLPHEKIIFSVMRAESPDFDPNSIDLITVAQSLHWFERTKFYQAAHRVLRKGGILAVWSYNLLSVEPQIDSVLQHFYTEVVGEYWPPERKFVEQGFPAMPETFKSYQAPPFSMQTRWHLEDLLGYVGTWSACKYYQDDTGNNPVDILADELQGLWSDPLDNKLVNWPLRLMIGKKVG